MKKEKLTTNKKNVDVNSNIREMKNSMARITQNKQITLFSLWSFNQSEAEKKRMWKYSINEKKNVLYDNQSIIKSTHVS